MVSSTPEHGGASSRVCLQGREHCTRHTQHAHAIFPGKQSPLLARTGICIIYCFHHVPPKTLCLLGLKVKLQTQQPEAGGAPGGDVPGCPLRDLMEATTPFHNHIPRNCIPLTVRKQFSFFNILLLYHVFLMTSPVYKIPFLADLISISLFPGFPSSMKLSFHPFQAGIKHLTLMQPFKP